MTSPEFRLNQYTAAGSASYQYDSSGNMTHDPNFHYTYDPENRLTKLHRSGQTPGPGGALAEAVDSGLSYTTGGDANWQPTNWPYHYGGDSAEGTAWDDGESWLQTEVEGAGTITFWWKVSSESGGDYLEFYIDGQLQNYPISGEVNWQQKSYTINTSGTHTLKWRYAKDSEDSAGDDCGWVDYVQWSGQAPQPETWTEVEYVYDASGRRIEKKYDGATVLKYIYDGDHCIAEYDASNNLARKYIYGPSVDEPICMIEAAGSYAGTYYYHFDALGSVVALTNSSGNTVEVYEYDVYGRVGMADPNHPNRFLFTSREFDQETGLYYYRARYYNPQIGRFLQTDPVGYGAGMNMYGYCGNSPIIMADPSGLDPIPISVAFYNGSNPLYGQYFRNAADDMTCTFDMSECPADIPIDVWIERKLKGLKRRIGEDAYNKIAGVYFMDHSNPSGNPDGSTELVTAMGFGNQALDTDSQQMKDLCRTLNGSLPLSAMIHFRCCSAGSDNKETMRRLDQIALWACRPVTAARGHIFDLTTPDGGKTVTHNPGVDPPYENYERDNWGRIVRNAPDYFCFWGYVIVTPESWWARCNNGALSWEEAQKAQGATRSLYADPVTGSLTYAY